VRGLARGGTTVFLTTQYLEEADQLADDIAVLHGGRIVARGSAEELKRRVGDGHAVLRLPDLTALERAAATLPSTSRDDEALTLVVPTATDLAGLRALLAQIEDAGVEVESFQLHQPDLDDVFLALTGPTAGAAR
jgi:ABC-2 type transport system ATP-binding protein